MKLFIYHIVSLILLGFVLNGLSSCREEIDIDLTDTIEDLPVELINTNIYGQVSDKFEQALDGVTVTIRDQQCITDLNGYFSFENIKADKNGTHIRASKNGYHQNVVTVYPSLNHSLFSPIILDQKIASATLLSTSGGEVALGNDASIYIYPNTLVFEKDGSNFEGTAHINYQLFSMEDPATEALLPGELIGLNELDERVGLHPAALIKLEITDGKMETLRLAKGQTAELTLLTGTADTEVLPAWIFNETAGRWVRSGTSRRLTGKSFSVDVDQFDYWCLANFYDIVKMEGHIEYVNSGSGTTARHRVVFEETDLLTEQEFLTDDQGYFSGYVPKGKDLSLKIYNECGNLVTEEELGSYDSNTELFKQLENVGDCHLVPVSGRLIDCSGNPVDKGYVAIESTENALFLQTDEQGRFSGQFRVCDQKLTIDITAGDYRNNQVSMKHTELLLSDSIRIGQWRVCETTGSISVQFLNEYFFLTDMVRFQTSSGSLLFEGSSPDLYVDCLISEFRGIDSYYILSESEAEFIVTVEPQTADGPALVPKNLAALPTYVLTVEDYTSANRITGSVQGLARDKNHGDREGMMHLKFDVPYGIK